MTGIGLECGSDKFSPRCNRRSKTPASMRAAGVNGGVFTSPRSQTRGLSSAAILLRNSVYVRCDMPASSSSGFDGCAETFAQRSTNSLLFEGHQQGANSVRLDRRKDFVYRVRDQVSPPEIGTLPKASRILAIVAAVLTNTTQPILHLQVA